MKEYVEADELRAALRALQQGRPSEAVERCNALVARLPARVDAWRMLGHAHAALEQGDAAIAAFASAYALQPESGALALEYGTHLLQAGRHREAKQPLRTAQARLPSDSTAAFRLGTAAYVTADYAEAVNAFTAACNLRPDWAQAWNNLAAAQGRNDQRAQALNAAENALRLAPDQADYHQALAALMSNATDLGALQRGLDIARRALALQPAHAAAHLTTGVLLRKLGDATQAEFHFRQAVRNDRLSTDAIEALGELLLAQNRADEATVLYTKAIDDGHDTADFWRQQGIARLQSGEAYDAIRILSESLRRQPDDQRTIAHMGVALAAAGQQERANALIGLDRNVHTLKIATPAGFNGIDEFNRALASDIRNHSQQRWEPVGLAARGSYLSGDLLADRTEAILGFERKLREAIDAFLTRSHTQPDDAFLRDIPRRYRLHIWATRADHSGFIDTHIHEESWLSGAYYVELPQAVAATSESTQGWIEFGRPYANLPQWPESALRLVKPETGLLLLFPSYVFHRTLPYRGDGERISISFDLAAA